MPDRRSRAWRAVSVTAMAAGLMSANGCGLGGCRDGVTVRAPEELADPSDGHVSVCALDQCAGERFPNGAHSMHSRFTDLEGLAVTGHLAMPDGSSYSGSSRFAERRGCTVATIELELDAEPG